MIGKIHSFQSLGTVDGPGVRCVVFVQGCPLRCICCHNPDTWDPNAGEAVDTDALFQKITRFRAYFGEAGGVTVSGGEPLLQADFVRDLFEKCKAAGISTALDTSGCILNEKVERLLDVTDLVLLDHKYPTEESYKKNARGSLAATEKFLDRLEERGIPVWLRRVVIPGVTDKESETAALVEVARAHKVVERIELLPFRDLCLEKYEAMHIPFPLAGVKPPDAETMEKLNALIPNEYK